MKRTILVVAGGFLLLLVLETVIYNWRLSLAIRYRDLVEECRGLERRRDELLVERAMLLNPARLQEVGESLGMGPVPLDMVSVFDPGSVPGNGGDAVVCLEQ